MVYSDSFDIKKMISGDTRCLGKCFILDVLKELVMILKDKSVIEHPWLFLRKVAKGGR